MLLLPQNSEASTIPYCIHWTQWLWQNNIIRTQNSSLPKQKEVETVITINLAADAPLHTSVTGRVVELAVT